MLPWTVQLRRALHAFGSEPGFRNRVLATVVALVFLISAFASGLEVNIRFGRTQDDTVARVASDIDPGLAGDAGGTAVLDGSTDAGSPVAAPGGSGASSSSSAAAAPGTTGARSAAPTASPGTPVSSGATYEQLLPAQLQAFTKASDCSGVATKATDRGMSATEIKLGWLIPNLNELKAAGFEVGLAGDWDRIIGGWVKELNRLKLGCRKVTYVKEIFDVLSVDDMLAKCKAMVSDHKVFAVFTPGGYDSVAQLCIARGNDTPLINPEPEPEGWYEQSHPYLWNMLMSKDRMHRNHVRWLTTSGSLKSSNTVGVVYHDIPNVAPSVKASMLTELKRQGITPKRVTALSADTEQAVSQITQVVVDFQQQGIDYVFMPMNLIFKSQFMQQAEKQNFFPAYTDSDHYFGCFDFVTSAYADRAWDKTKCVSAVDVAGMRPDDARKLADQHPLTRYSDQVYKRAWPEGYDNNGESSQETADTQRALFAGTGEQVLLFKQAFDRAGVNVTRKMWGESMAKTGRYCTIIRVECITFGPRKWDGPDLINVVQWHAEESNGYDARTYQRLVPPFRAYY